MKNAITWVSQRCVSEMDTFHFTVAVTDCGCVLESKQRSQFVIDHFVLVKGSV